MLHSKVYYVVMDASVIVGVCSSLICLIITRIYKAYGVNNNLYFFQLAGYNDQILDAVFVGAGESHLVVATNSIQLRIYHCESFSCCLVKGHTALVLALARHPALPTIFASRSDCTFDYYPVIMIKSLASNV